jgi:hypothetical protein
MRLAQYIGSVDTMGTSAMNVRMTKEKFAIFAASSANAEERARAGNKHEDGSTPIEPEKRAWRPQMKSEYVDKDRTEEELEHLDLLFKDYGTAAMQERNKLTPREEDDIIHFEEKYITEFESNVNWENCPEENQAEVTTIIKQYWDVFVEEGIKKPVRGLKFHIDTGDSVPICCKQRNYGPFESKIIDELVQTMEENGLIELYWHKNQIKNTSIGQNIFGGYVSPTDH